MTILEKSVTSTVYVVKEGRVLLHIHKKFNTWFPLGGHVERNELPHEAALREAREEAGLEIRLISTEVAPDIDVGRVVRIPAPFCLYGEEGREEDYFDFIYVATTDDEALHPDRDESKIFRWFSREDLLTSDVKPHIKNTALAVLEYLGNHPMK
ncbi:MAG: NUDIX domain-containing protein [Clostridia bacterium]|nr:NUDIX domain-containing protein [Clostridia bacterium]